MAYLITGIAGGLSRLAAAQLVARGQEVVGVDYRRIPPMPTALAAVPTYRANYNKTAIEDVFRRHKFSHVLHLGRVGNLKESLGKRFDLNVVGSQKIMNLCLQHGVSHVVVLSTFHIYGAHPANHIPIAEDEPLRAGTDFPQLADAIQLDNMASTWVYRHPEAHVVVLRPTNVIGPTVNNALSTLLRRPRVPFLAGYNPMTQLLHAEDLAGAILRAADAGKGGIYNVTGDDSVPWRTALSLVGCRTLPLPSSLVMAYLRAFSQFPVYLVNFFKFPCIITDRAFRDDFGWAPRHGLRETLLETVAPTRHVGHAAEMGGIGR